MKRKQLILLLALEAGLCAALAFTSAAADAFFTALSFPYAQIGLGLRALSLAGSIGNAAAVALYAALSLTPVGYLIRARSKRKLFAEDALLALLSMLLFAVFYLMTNEGNIPALLAGDPVLIGAGKAVLGGTADAVIVGYLMLRMLRAARESGTDKLYGLLKLLVGALALAFVWAIFYVCFNELLASFSVLRAGNTGGGLGMSYAFLVLKFLVDALPWAFNIVLSFVAAELLSAMRLDRYSEAALAASERLARLSAKALAAAVLSNVLFNVLQLIFASTLRNVSGVLVIPMDSIAFALFALLFARLTGENRLLKEDNELIV